MNKTLITIPSKSIISRIFLIRGKKVMFDRDLAELYEVDTKALNQAVKRNASRFPEDFSFTLNQGETKVWQREISRSQIVTLKQGSNIKYSPRVFTEQGVAMLSSILKSKKAVQTNIQIIRTFTKLREILSENKNLAERLEKMEKKYDTQITKIFDAIKLLVSEKSKSKGKIGFDTQ